MIGDTLRVLGAGVLILGALGFLLLREPTVTALLSCAGAIALGCLATYAGELADRDTRGRRAPRR